jgi:ABC-type lipoprotein release transport system permease subunit
VIWRLAWRGLQRNPRRTGVVIVAVAVGIGGCLLTIAINLGMAVQMVDTAISTELGHVQIHAAGFEAAPELARILPDNGEREARAVQQLAGVEAFSRRVRGQGLVSSPRASVGVRVLAVEPDRESRVSRLEQSLVEGEWLGSKRGRVVIGVDLARSLRVGLGSKIVLSVQDLAGDLTGRPYRVGGLFRTASREANHRTVLLPLDEAQSLFGIGDGISEIVLLADRRGSVESLRAELAHALGPRAEVRSWEELRPLLVYMVELFDQTAWVIYAGVFIAMAFGIANVLLMSVYERTREIGVMMAMGMKPRRVVLTVVAESLVVTLVGLALGLAVGATCVSLLSEGIPLGGFATGLDAFGIGNRIVPVLRWEDLLAPLVMAVVSAVLASAWPAARAAALRPSEALRHV